MYSAIHSASLLGAAGAPLTVEVHIGNGLPGFTVVGQPDEACRESRDRVRAALLCSGHEWPNRRITVNLAGPGDRKGGSGLDLAVAVAMLVAMEVIPAEAADRYAFIGELGLDGTVRPVPGTAPLAYSVEERRVVVAMRAHAEARMAVGDRAVGVGALAELVEVLRDGTPWPDVPLPTAVVDDTPVPDMADVRGQLHARLGLEIAAAGNHHMLMVGPPGAGKSMLASRMPGLLPRLGAQQALECALVRGSAGLVVPVPPTDVPPFRAPHHSATLAAVVGGGNGVIRPGEISLAHNGVLFLDEMSEFAPSVLDALRQPLEEGVVRIARAHAAVELPAGFLLVAATNPCPCADERPTNCGCTPQNRNRYLRRISGPLMDRFDVRVWLTRPSTAELLGASPGEPTHTVAARVREARGVAHARQGCPNAAIPASRLDELAPFDHAARRLVEKAMREGQLTARGYHRIRRVARTIADLRGEHECINEDHARTALDLRRPVGGKDPK